MITLKKPKVEYEINNKIKYTTLQIRSILVKGNKHKKTKKAPTRIPPGGMGNGLERAYSKDDFITEVIISKK